MKRLKRFLLLASISPLYSLGIACNTQNSHNEEKKNNQRFSVKNIEKEISETSAKIIVHLEDSVNVLSAFLSVEGVNSKITSNKIIGKEIHFFIDNLNPETEYLIKEIELNSEKINLSDKFITNKKKLPNFNSEDKTNEGSNSKPKPITEPVPTEPIVVGPGENPFPDEDFAYEPPKFDKENDNSYPSYADKFKKVDEQVLYQELYDRTFSIKVGVHMTPNESNKHFISNDTGTAWILDYHRYNENKYKLFFASNLHVLNKFSNSLSPELNEKLNYQDSRGYKVNSITIGKTKNRFTSFPTVPNNHPYSMQEKYESIFYTSGREFTEISSTDTSAQRTKLSQGFISKPKLVFAAYDFIDKSYLQDTQDDLKSKIKDRIKYLEGNDPESEELNILKSYKNDFISPYSDFGVFEIDVDLTKMDETLRNWIENAITALDSYLLRLKQTNSLPNQDKSISTFMQTTDYLTASRLHKNQNNLTNAKDVYILGYPGGNHGKTYLVKNNPEERNSELSNDYRTGFQSNAKSFAYPTNGYESNFVTNNLQPYTKVFGKVLSDYYGYNMEAKFSSLTYGSSGSLVYNEFGQMIGIYNSVSADVRDDDLMRVARFGSFLLSKDYVLGNKVMKAFNLIDGTNKNLYPAQTHSYRENLKIIYPDGFEENNFKTALFPEGFK
ncbi:MIP family Ig-specific serine endopeptidase [Mycoplasmopsis canis]|uniref:MIP family Ig-specific serine endopeptidase n=1 Tax=Mycoplasmopsis canis TaxID=29555 RepID=UPI00025AF013|nr:DUF31 family protein [Mycoplasmopsis canis]EIE40922.1 hypothetical protein MCANUF33_00498 [Mycoplasmopsis canis UF33]